MKQHELPLHRAKYDVHCSLEDRWSIVQPETHSCNPTKIVAWSKYQLFSVALFDFILTVPWVRAYNRKHCHLFQAFSTFFHARERVRVVRSNSVQCSRVEIKVRQVVFVETQDSECSPFESLRFNHPFSEHYFALCRRWLLLPWALLSSGWSAQVILCHRWGPFVIWKRLHCFDVRPTCSWTQWTSLKRRAIQTWKVTVHTQANFSWVSPRSSSW